MDTNDYRDQNTGGQYDPAGYGQYQHGNYPNYGGYYSNQYPGGKKKGGGALKAVLAVLMVLCLIAGGIFTAFVIMPAVYPSIISRNPLVVTAAPDAATEGNGGGKLTTDSPQIGGAAPEIASSDEPYVQVAKAVTPAVVMVRIDDPRTADEYDPQGTGIIITGDGYIVTNNHVISQRGRFNIIIKTSDDKEYTAKVVGADVTSDLAVLKIDAAGLTAAALGDSDTLQVGQRVVAIGNANGLGQGTVTTGIISALDKSIRSGGFSQKYIQTDTAINPGNSGGPLVDMKGKVIGIVTLKSFISEYNNGLPISSEGIGFAIPINTAKPVIEQIMTTGSVARPGIGITCTVDSEHEYNPSGSPDGVTVINVTQGSGADKAGIQPADIITTADGKALKSVDDLLAVIQSHKIGDTIDVTVWRSGQYYSAKIIVGDLNKTNQ